MCVGEGVVGGTEKEQKKNKKWPDELSILVGKCQALLIFG